MLSPIINLLKTAAELYKNNFKVFLGYIILTVVPGLILGVIAVMSASAWKTIGVAITVNKPTLALLIGTSILVVGLFFIISLWFNIVLTRVISFVVNGKPIPLFKTNLKEAGALVWRVIWTIFLVGVYCAWPLIITGGLIMLNAVVLKFLPGWGKIWMAGSNIITAVLVIFGLVNMTYFSFRLLFAYYAAAIDDKTAKEAIKFSKRLTAGRWWAVFGRIVAITLFVWVALAIVGGILIFLGGLTGGWGDGLASAVSNALNILAGPLVLSVVLVLYSELKKSDGQTPSTNL